MMGCDGRSTSTPIINIINAGIIFFFIFPLLWRRQPMSSCQEKPLFGMPQHPRDITPKMFCRFESLQRGKYPLEASNSEPLETPFHEFSKNLRVRLGG
jgi:hypothetical protein